MQYTKPPQTYAQQADLLLSRGMLGDRDLMVQQLSVVNYYRLSGYWYPFRELPNNSFRAGTTFEEVWSRYAFDRQLRLLVMDAIERVEIAFRAWLAYELAHVTNDPFAYANDPSVLPELRGDNRSRFFAELLEQTRNSKEAFAVHFLCKYGSDHDHMPLWMACEIMTFGHVVTMFRGAPQEVKRRVSAGLAIHDKVVFSWLLALNTIRNLCAHHSRLWNRVLGNRPAIPAIKGHPEWHRPVEINNDRVFGVLTILKFCLDCVAPQSNWATRLFKLLEDFPKIPRKSMGFPDNWRESPIWQLPADRLRAAEPKRTNG